MTGIVYKSTGSWYTVKADTNEFFECRIKGKFRIKGIKSTNPIAVGDKVDFDLDTTADVVTGVITNIHERKNYCDYRQQRKNNHNVFNLSYFEE